MGKKDQVKPQGVDIPESAVSVYQALYRRRMAWRFKEDPVEREVLARLLDTAVWAPNHHLTEPWRFFVLEKEGETRRQVGELAYQHSLADGGNRRRAEAMRDKVLSPPALIYAYSKPGDNAKTAQENYASVCCAVQNISLAAVAEGLAVTWETGRITRLPDLPKVLGAKKKWQMVGLLMIGYPDEAPTPARTPAERFTWWL